MASEIAKQAADDPPQHNILLVPADPKYSPTEDVLWPADRWCGPMGPMVPGMIWERVSRETRNRPNYQEETWQPEGR